MSLLSFIPSTPTIKLDVPSDTLLAIPTTSETAISTLTTTSSNPDMITAIVDDIHSKKYGCIPNVVKGRVMAEDMSGFKRTSIDTSRMLDILQGKIRIQPMDYCKTVDIKIALERDENGKATHLTQKELLLSMSLLRFYKNFRNLYIFTKLVNGDSAISLRLIEYFVVNYVVDHNTVYNMLHYQANPSYLINRLDKPSVATRKANTTQTTNIGDKKHNARAIDLTTNKDEIKADINKNQKIQEKRKLVGEELDIMMDFDNYILVHDRYKAQLKEHSKLSFDPFCRSTRICHSSNTSRSTRICLVLPGGVTLSTTIAQMNFFRWAIKDHVLEYILDNQSIIDSAMAEYETNKTIDNTVYSKTNDETATAGDVTASNADVLSDTEIDTMMDASNDSTSELKGNDTMGIRSNRTINRTKKATGDTGGGRRRRRGRDNNRSVTRYTCRRIITFN